MEQKQLTKAEKLAEEVLILSRNTLLVNLRFLDAALSQFEMKPVDESSMLTDGHFLLYNPKHVLSNFRHQKETVVRDYLHIVMHCVYRHMFMDEQTVITEIEKVAGEAIKKIVPNSEIKVYLMKTEYYDFYNAIKISVTFLDKIMWFTL